MVLRWNLSYEMSFFQAVQRGGENEQEIVGGKDDEVDKDDDFAI